MTKRIHLSELWKGLGLLIHTPTGILPGEGNRGNEENESITSNQRPTSSSSTSSIIPLQTSIGEESEIHSSLLGTRNERGTSNTKNLSGSSMQESSRMKTTIIVRDDSSEQTTVIPSSESKSMRSAILCI